jgi:chromosome partitioning protein
MGLHAPRLNTIGATMTATVTAFANQKGGVGKTTSALSVAAAMAELGRAVLVVDLDPQACLTFSLGYDPDTMEPSLHDTVTGRASLADTIVQHGEVDLAPANIDLAGAEVTLLSRTGREYLLRGELYELLDSYDHVLIDCAPSLGVLTINGLTAADQVVIPVQCETLSHRGVAQLLETIHDVRRLTNRGLKVRGLLATMFDPRTRHGKEVLRDLLARYELPLIGAPVRKSIRFAEAPTEGQSLLRTGHDVPGAAAYRIIARALVDEAIPEELWEQALWDPTRRAEILGEEPVQEGPAQEAPRESGQEPSARDAVPVSVRVGPEDDLDSIEVIDLDREYGG